MEPMPQYKYEAAFEACKAAIRDIFSVELGQGQSSGQAQQAAANPAPAASKSGDKTSAPATPKSSDKATAASVPSKAGSAKLPKAPAVVSPPPAKASASPSYSNINNLPQTAPQTIDDWNNILFSEQILKSIDKRKFAETIIQKWSEYVDITTTTRTETSYDYDNDRENSSQVTDYKIQIKADNWASMIAIKTIMGTPYTTNQIVYDTFRECKK